ncbi:hypothetical protein HB852_11050 [Listeria grandensis]|uniref:hypothetical protein n=1 Tax=Listeria grandensis TaxID=1494963 RepID=UPI0016277E10|nr:hypothetical protein [Listeria grandensis]MBC1475155.1 hypothetical protein [Listeria grandensis]
MESIFTNISDWFGTAIVIIGILFGLISYFKKAETEKEEEAKTNLPNVPKQRSKHPQPPRKTAKKPQQRAYKDTVIKDAVTYADTDVTRAHHHHTVTRKRVRGKMQEAIIMKEILDKPVSLRSDK